MKLFTSIKAFLLSVLAKLLIKSDKQRYHLQVVAPKKLDERKIQLRDFAATFFTGEFWYNRETDVLERMNPLEAFLVRYAKIPSDVLSLDLEDGFNPWRELTQLVLVVLERKRLATYRESSLKFQVNGHHGKLHITMQLRVIIRNGSHIEKLMLNDFDRPGAMVVAPILRYDISN